MTERALTGRLGQQSNSPRSKCRVILCDKLEVGLRLSESGALDAVERNGMYGQGCCGESRGSNNTSRHNACEERNKMMTGLV